MKAPVAESPSDSFRDAAAWLDFGEPRSLPALTILCAEGQVTDSCYLVLQGDFVVAKSLAGERTELETCGPGSLLALMPALDGEPCAVTISALNEASVLVVTRERLLASFDETGEPNRTLASRLSLLAIRRLRSATTELTAALLCALRSPDRAGHIDPVRLARIQAGGYAWRRD